MNVKMINWFIYVMLCFIWGSSFWLIKISNLGLTPYQVASLRIFSGAIIFIPVALYQLRRVSSRDALLLMLAGFFGNLLPAFCFAIALVKIHSSLAGILNALTPLCVIVVGVLFFKNRISSSKLLGVLAGFSGLVLLTLTQENINLKNAGYSTLVLLATLSYGFNVNLVSHYLKHLKALEIASISLAFMSIPSGLALWQQDFFSVEFNHPPVRWAIISCLFLGVVGSAVATILFYFLVQKAGGLFASLVTYGIPFVALFWGIMDGEPFTLSSLLCLALILLGVFLANRPDKKLGKSVKASPIR